MSKARYWICGFLLFIVVAALVFLPLMIRGMEDINKLTAVEIHDLDLSSVPDGVHPGAYNDDADAFLYRVRVEVTVADGLITDIAILENEDREPSLLAEGVAPQIIETQTPLVSAVSGATISSKSIMKAVENALVAAGATVIE